MFTIILQLATSPTVVVPEANTATALMLGLGVLGLGFFARFIKNRRK